MKLRKKLKNKLNNINELYNSIKEKKSLVVPRIAYIELINNQLYLYCEKYSLLNNSMIFCFGGIIDDSKILKEIKKIDSNNEKEVLSFIEELNTFINWNDVKKQLYYRERETFKGYDFFYINYENERINFSSKDIALNYYKDLIDLYEKDESKKYYKLYKTILNLQYGYSDGSLCDEEKRFGIEDYKNQINVL